VKLPAPLLQANQPLPDPAKSNRDGCVAITRELTPQRLLEAYPKGIFPWTENPVTWWSPDPRGILPLDRFHVPARLEQTIRSGIFSFTINHSFDEVVQGCAEPAIGREESWVGPAFRKAYSELHRMGYAQSFEVWHNGKLAGGLYGVRMGGFFAGESMFHRVRDASSVALVLAVRYLIAESCSLFDLQMVTPHTAKFGGIEVSRDEYLQRLKRAIP
jgi:leucyl/phenylalanyl-tRNA---protein transferase